MENWNTRTQTLSSHWVDVYPYIRIGDLVSVGPVQNKKLGIALEYKHVSFGHEPDEWHILIDGKVETYSIYYICVFQENELQNSRYAYNLHQQYGDRIDDKRW